MFSDLFSENKSKEVEDCIDYLHTYNDCQNDEFFQFLVQIDRFLEYIDFFCSHSEGICLLILFHNTKCFFY